MSNRQSNVNQAIRRQELLICLREAIQTNDSRNRRTQISDSLRLADMNSIDGLEVLFHALKEKYEPMVLDEIPRPNSPASPAPKPRCREVMGASPQGEHKCESCGEGYPSAKALSGHGPQRCMAKKRIKT